MENQEKKTRSANRTHDEMIEELDKKIAYHHMQIVQLEAKKAELAQPKRERKPSFSGVVAQLKGMGLTPEQLLQLAKNAG